MSQLIVTDMSTSSAVLGPGKYHQAVSASITRLSLTGNYFDITYIMDQRRDASGRSAVRDRAPETPSTRQGYRIWCFFLSSFPRKRESMAAANTVEGWIPAFAGM